MIGGTGAPAAEPLANTMAWIAALLTGSLATSLAMIAVGWAGLAVLSGHASVRGAARLVIGCFVLFGAGALSSGLVEAARSAAVQPGAPSPPPATRVPVPSAQPTFDPYSGATVPN